ncbi:hypothetical protein JOM56_012527 [Amanita muscaria]
MSQKARRIWIALKKAAEAPATWGQISTDLHEYYVREMCDDGEWKLLEWTRKSYSSWTLWNGHQEKKLKKPSLDDSDLIKMPSNETTPFLSVEEIPPTSNEPPLFFANPLSVGDDDVREKEPESVSASTIATGVNSTTSSEHDNLASGDMRAPADAAQPTPPVVTPPASGNGTIAAASLSKPNPSSNLDGSGEDLGAPGDKNVTQSTISKKRSSEVLEVSGTTSQTEAGTLTTTSASTVTITVTSAAKKHKISEDTLAVPSKAFSDRNYCMIDWCMKNAGGKLYKFSEHWESLSTDERKRTDVNNKLFKRQADAAQELEVPASQRPVIAVP